MMRLAICLLAAAATTPLVAQPRVAGRVVLVGDPPMAEAIDPGPDACCRAAGPIDERLLVGPNGGLANVVVSLETRRGEEPPPKIERPLGEPPTLTNLGCAFRPRVAIARVGETLVLTNDDPTMHNVAIDFVRNPAVNVVVEPEGKRRLTLARAERRPVPVRCNVHPFMAAWVVVRADGYVTVSDERGRFALPSPPPGEWRLRLWHEGQSLAGVSVAAAITDRRGEATITVTGDAGLDLGEVRVTADRFRGPD